MSESAARGGGVSTDVHGDAFTASRQEVPSASGRSSPMQVQGAAIQSSMDVGNGSDHAQPLPAVPFCASTASTTASSLAVLPTAAASDSGQGLLQGSEIRLTSRNAPSGVPIAPLPRTLKKEELEKLGGHSIRELRKYLLTHWHCTNCKCVWHGIPTTSTLFHLEWHTIPKFIASFCVYSSLRALQFLHLAKRHALWSVQTTEHA